MTLKQVFSQYPVKAFISALWGFALSLLFRKTCAQGRCTFVKGQPLEKVQSSVYNYGDSGRCYRFNPYLVQCTASENMGAHVPA